MRCVRETNASQKQAGFYRYKQEPSTFVKSFQYPKGMTWGYPVEMTEMLFVMEGEFFISYDLHLECKVQKGEMLLLSPGTHFNAYTTTGVSFVLLQKQSTQIRLCDRFSLEDLPAPKFLSRDRLPLLEIKPPVRNLISMLMTVIDSGLHCDDYLDLKLTELFFLLRGYYTKQELAIFFHPLLNKDLDFAGFILNNYRGVKTVTEFAALYSCSLSSFDKKFRRTFGTSAYQWMKDRKARLIYHQISTTQKTFRQIAKEQGFLSLPQFTDFCKKHLGDAPSRIRKRDSIKSGNS